MILTRIVTPATMKKSVREPLAVKLRRNWLAKHANNPPEMVEDDSLTNLDWLLDLNMTKVMSSTSRNTTTTPQFSSNTQVNPNAILDVSTEPASPVYVTRPVVEVAHHHSAVTDYRNDSRKPPYSYAKLIACAIKNSDGQKSTLSGIYNWIMENFLYYRLSDATWHNSIRHNLSLNKSFMKIPRRKDEPGKGGFWAINPDHAEQNIGDVLFKKRNYQPECEVIQAPPPKRIKREREETPIIESPQEMFHAMTETQEAFNVVEYSDDSSSFDTYAKPEDTSSFQSLSKGWNAILHQDIEVGGVKIKTEHLLDEADEAARAITSYSPPPSEHSSSDLLFDDLLKEFDPSVDNPLSNGDVPLDMTVARDHKGDNIMNNWWDSSQDSFSQQTDSRMSTPTHSGSDTEHSLPWTDDAEHVPGYFDHIFDLSGSFTSHAVSVL